MALDEAHRLLQSLIADEADARKRARLSEVQLALGWPYALQIHPKRLEELRAHEVNGPLLRSQSWLAAASAVAFTGYGFFAVLAFFFGVLEHPRTSLLPFSGLLAGALVGLWGLASAWMRRPGHASLVLLAASWVALPAYAALAQRLAHAGVVALLSGIPAVLVAAAALLVRPHVAR